MNQYGITLIEWDETHSYVERAQIHELAQKAEKAGQFTVSRPRELPHTDIAGLIALGSVVHVLVATGADQFESHGQVYTAPDHSAHLESRDASGARTQALFDLPELYD